MQNRALKFKAQGMYPTPKALAQRVVFETFRDDKAPPKGILEPSAGYGVFITEAWEYWQVQRKLKRSQLEKLVSNTYAFENDEATFNTLKANLSSWCRKAGLAARPQLIKTNFLYTWQRHLTNLPEDFVVLGNPPWDEFTTRKHDALGMETVKRIRDERSIERSQFATTGLKNLYQAFLQEILKIPSEGLRVAMVLPRQLLGDKGSQDLRRQLLDSGTVRVTGYRNKDERFFFFEAVDTNFEIIVLTYVRGNQRAKSVPVVHVRRGFSSAFRGLSVRDEDYTIPIPPHYSLNGTLGRVLTKTPFGEWMSKWSIEVSMGRTKSSSPDYKRAESGRTIKAYQAPSKMVNTVLVMNKILPNSTRKLKAAAIGSGSDMAESLVSLYTPRSEVYPYLLLMLNSRALELGIRSLMSNINLNLFRLRSLPLPEPSKHSLAQADKLWAKCMLEKISFEEASDLLAKDVFSLSSDDQRVLKNLFPNRKDSMLP